LEKLDLTIEEWRFVDLDFIEGPFSGAIFEAIVKARSKNTVPNTIFFWRVKNPCIYLGYHQLAKSELKMETCKKLGIPVVRRILGGGCSYCDKNQLLYSITINEDHPRISNFMEGAYKYILSGVVKGFQNVGLKNVHFNDKLNAIIVNGKKISGNAGFNGGKAIMINGSFILDFDYEAMSKVLIDPLKNLPGSPKKPEDGLTSIRRELGRRISIGEAKFALKKGFEEALDIKLVNGTFTKEELQMASNLKQKYLTDEWIFLMDLKREKMMKTAKSQPVPI
jgi:lipoate-protein ligase A